MRILCANLSLGYFLPKLKAYLKEASPTTLIIAYQRAKRWEEIHLGVTYIPPNLAQNSYLDQVGVKRNDVGVAINLTAYIQPNYVNMVPMASVPIASMFPVEQVRVNPIGTPSHQGHPRGKEANSGIEAHLVELTKQLGNLQVNLATKTSEKKNQPNNDRAHIWCTNCRGHGHMLLACP